MAKARAVVTGGAGFLGSHLCERLLDGGIEVVCIDNLITGNVANIEHLIGRDGFVFVKHDVTNYLTVDGDVELVLHFASPASPIDYLELPIQTLKVGSLGTHKALGLAKAKGARFLLASTSEIYGDPLVHPQPETYWGNVNPVGPRGVYDEAKRFAEAMTMAYHRSHGVSTRIVRIFNTYGPRMRPHDGRVVPAFICQALAGRAAHGVRRRLADALVLLRRRPGRGHLAAAVLRDLRPGQHRQPGGDDDPAVRGADPRPRGPVACRSSSGRCRSTTRRCGSPTSRWRAPGSAGSRASRSRPGWRGRSSTSGRYCSATAPRPDPGAAGARGNKRHPAALENKPWSRDCWGSRRCSSASRSAGCRSS